MAETQATDIVAPVRGMHCAACVGKVERALDGKRLLAQPFAQGGRGLWKHDTELTQEPADSIDAGGSLFLEAFAQAMDAQDALLRDGLGRDEVHVGPRSSLTDRGGGVRIVLAAPPLETVWCDELRWMMRASNPIATSLRHQK